MYKNNWFILSKDEDIYTFDNIERTEYNYGVAELYRTDHHFANWDDLGGFPTIEKPFFANPKYPLLDYINIVGSPLRGMILSNKAIDIIMKFGVPSVELIPFSFEYKDKLNSDYSYLYFVFDATRLLDFNKSIFKKETNNGYERININSYDELRSIEQNGEISIRSYDLYFNLDENLDIFLADKVTHSPILVSERLKIELEKNTIGLALYNVNNYYIEVKAK